MKNVIAALENFLTKIFEKQLSLAKHKIFCETQRVVIAEIEKFLKSEKKALTKANAKIVLEAAMNEAIENYQINEKKRNPLLIPIDCVARHINVLLANWSEPDSDPQDSIRDNNTPLSPSKGASQNVEGQEEDEEEAQDHLARYWEIQARANGQSALDDAYVAAEKSKNKRFLYSLVDDKILEEIATKNYINVENQKRLAGLDSHNKSTSTVKSYSSRQREFA